MIGGQTLIQIRERSYLDVLDLALLVARQRPVTLGLAAVLGIAPWAALNAWLFTPWEPSNLGPYLYLMALEAPWATAPLTIVLGGLMFGRRPSVGQVLLTLIKSLFQMIVYQGIIRAILVFPTIFTVLIPVKLAFLNEVILLERGRWWRAVRRSSDLCGDRGGKLFGQWLAQFAFGGLFIACFWLAAGTFGHAMVAELTWEFPEWSSLYDIRTQIALWTAIAFFAVARFFTYIDQRIRLEGWEVELRLRAVAATLEDSERWAESR
jgi:hypothetical protein